MTIDSFMYGSCFLSQFYRWIYKVVVDRVFFGETGTSVMYAVHFFVLNTYRVTSCISGFPDASDVVSWLVQLSEGTVLMLVTWLPSGPVAPTEQCGRKHSFDVCTLAVIAGLCLLLQQQVVPSPAAHGAASSAHHRASEGRAGALRVRIRADIICDRSAHVALCTVSNMYIY